MIHLNLLAVAVACSPWTPQPTPRPAWCGPTADGVSHTVATTGSKP